MHFSKPKMVAFRGRRKRKLIRSTNIPQRIYHDVRVSGINWVRNITISYFLSAKYLKLDFLNMCWYQLQRRACGGIKDCTLHARGDFENPHRFESWLINPSGKERRGWNDYSLLMRITTFPPMQAAPHTFQLNYLCLLEGVKLCGFIA